MAGDEICGFKFDRAALERMKGVRAVRLCKVNEGYAHHDNKKDQQ